MIKNEIYIIKLASFFFKKTKKKKDFEIAIKNVKIQKYIKIR